MDASSEIMSETIPIIGITGGIGSGKSYVARAFKNYGCAVADADSNVKKVLNDPEIQEVLKSWWGDMVINGDQTTNRKYIASIVFKDNDARQKLESLVHPIVRSMQIEQFENMENSTVAFIIDAPLLLETDLYTFCDAIIFVKANYAASQKTSLFIVNSIF